MSLFIRLFCVLLAFSLLTACATRAKYEAALNSWVGYSAEDLILVWGPPDSIFDMPSGSEVYTFIRYERFVSPGYPPTYTTTVVGDTAITTPIGGSPTVVHEYYCETNFIFDANMKIKAHNFHGNGCQAY